MSPKDISDQPVTQREMYQLVEHHGNRVSDALIKAVNEILVAYTESVNKALVAVMASKQHELVRPTSVKRITRDEHGNLVAIEEFKAIQ